MILVRTTNQTKYAGVTSHIMTKNSQYTDNKELMIIKDAVHTDLYDNIDKIPFEKIVCFFIENMR